MRTSSAAAMTQLPGLSEAERASKQSKVKILYIGSAGRSGSTLLDLMLGQGEGMFSTGEVRYLWDRGYLANELCGCGDPFRRCLFWQRVTEQAFGSFAEAERAAAYFSEHAPVRWRQLPMLMNLWGNPEANGHLGTLTETLGNVYAAIQQVSGASVIVDSSKLITCGLILNRIPNVDISVLHLVRDSRAVAYSWQRKKLRPEIHWKQEYMPKCSPFESSRDWMMFNLMTRRLISEVGKPSLFLRYEDAVANPDAD